MSQHTVVPKIYCDTGHLVNIANLEHNPAKVREAFKDSYGTLRRWIADGSVALIFNPAAPLEWVDGGATLQTALQLAEVVDSARTSFEVETDKFVFLREVLDEIRRTDISLVLPEFEVFFLRTPGGAVRRPLPVLMREAPGYIDPAMLLEGAEKLPAEIPIGDAVTNVECAWNFRKNHTDAYRERIDGFRAAFEQDLDILGARSGKGIQPRDILEWLTRYLQVDLVIRQLNPNADTEALLNQVDIAGCPATRLFLDARERRIRAKEPVKDNDVDDWLTVPIAAYSDILLTERNLRSYLHQADPMLSERVFHNPNEAVLTLENRYGLS